MRNTSHPTEFRRLNSTKTQFRIEGDQKALKRAHLNGYGTNGEVQVRM